MMSATYLRQLVPLNPWNANWRPCCRAKRRVQAHSIRFGEVLDQELPQVARPTGNEHSERHDLRRLFKLRTFKRAQPPHRLLNLSNDKLHVRRTVCTLDMGTVQPYPDSQM